MAIKCKNCAGVINYDVTTGRLVCGYCGSTYTKYDYASEIEMGLANLEETTDTKAPVDFNPDDIFKPVSDEMDEVDAWFNEQEQIKKGLVKKEEFIEEDGKKYHFFVCAECGAQVISQSNEVSTYCAFCGQNTVNFDRLGSKKMPDYIIPFDKTKEEAIKSIRKRVSESKYVPKDFAEFSDENVVGLYVPYNIYSCDCDTLQKKTPFFLSKIRAPKDDEGLIYVYADMQMKYVTVDASKKFNNQAAEWIEPYYFDKAVGFDPTYLMGFFADVSDEKAENMEVRSKQKLKTILNKAVDKKYPGNIELNSTNFDNITCETVLLPVWMLTKTYEGEAYTFLVNGQTGKTVGALPINKTKTTLMAILLMLLFTIVATGVLFLLYFSVFLEYARMAAMTAIIVAVIFVIFAVVNVKEYRRVMAATRDLFTNKLVTSRLEKRS